MPALYGWYRENSTIVAEMMPDPNAPCMVCCKPMLDVKAAQIRIGDLTVVGDPRVYFFRIHIECSKMVCKSDLDALVRENIFLDKVAIDSVQKPLLVH